MIRRTIARVAAASAALTRWERQHPIISGFVTAPAIAGLMILLALSLHVVFGV